MITKSYFSYVRVSTQRQGQLGTSLAEQNAAIERHAQKYDLKISKRYEERETAARQGRPVFLEMLKELKRGRACGVIIHKIDRSARNLKDWADLGSLIDSGVEVQFAAESLDLSSRGGRLSADIQAVVAADYIRNLKEEVKKGFYGRLKQGLYPMPAPIGYVDAGQGQPKKLHPVYAPLVKKAFELYATRRYGIVYLLEEMTQLGLRNKTGGTLSKNTFNGLLKNEFYTGVIKIRKTGEVFPGQHKPIISRNLFERVQAVMSGKTTDKQNIHFFLFRRLVSCAGCARKLIPERQKGWVYYRCQTRDCPQKTTRGEIIEKGFCRMLRDLRFDTREQEILQRLIEQKRTEIDSFTEKRKQALALQIEQSRERLSRLTDALIDGAIDRDLFVNKKNNLVLEERRLQDELDELNRDAGASLERTQEILKMASNSYSSYKSATDEDRREMIKTLTSNLVVEDKSLIIKLNLPFELILNRSKRVDGGATRDILRTLACLIERIIECLQN